MLSEREEIRAEIRKLEGERAELNRDREVLEFAHEVLPDGPHAKSIDTQLDEILDRLDAISDEIGPLIDRLWVLDAEISRREHFADVAYGRRVQ